MTIAPANNFNTLRLLAALAVVASHSVPITTGSDRAELIFRLSDGQATGGKIAVGIFFVISGYLITGSYARTNSPLAFTAARALRLLPGLAVVLAAMAFAIGPAISSLPVRAYFAAPEPWWMLPANLSLLANPDALPGVFQTTPIAGPVNGSLWTLQYEARCYLAVLLLGLCRLLNRYIALAALIDCCIAQKRWIGGETMDFYAAFAAGAALYLWRPPLNLWLAAACAALCLAAVFLGGFRIAAATLGAYTIIAGAHAPRLPDLARYGDLSYGTYLWAFPLQQLAVSALGGPWWLNLAASLPPILALAWLSWHLVEAPALRLKPRRT